MNSKVIIGSYFVIAMVFTSCFTDKNIDKELNLPIHDHELVFDLDSKSSLYTSFFQVLKNSILFRNTYNNCIYEYPLNFDQSNDIKNIICFDLDGPNSIGVLNSFYYHSSDTIFTIGSNNLKINVCNSQSLKKGEIDIQKSLKGIPPFQIIIDNKRKGFIDKNNLILPLSFYNIDGVESLNKNLNILIFDLETKEAELRIRYPPVYHNRTWNHFLIRPSIERISSNDFIISFPIENDVFRMKLPNKIEKINLESTNVKVDLGSKNHRYLGSGMEMSINYLKVLSYPSILFDKENNYLLRLLNVPRKVLNSGEEIIINDKKLFIYDISKGFRLLRVIQIHAEKNLSGDNMFCHSGIVFLQTISSKTEDKKIFKGYNISSLVNS